MEIKIPPGRTGKIAIGIVAMGVIGKYAGEWVKKGLKNPLNPSVFIAVILAILILIIAIYWVQGHQKKI